MNIKKVLAVPALYSLFRKLAGNDDARQRYADRFIRAQANSKVLDIGCGTGDILRYLPDVDYVGFDMSPHYIESARRRFGGRGEFFCEKVGNGIHAPDDTFDIALAHGVLHHLDDEEANELFTTAWRSLKPGGRLVTFDGCYTSDQSAVAKFLVSQDRGRFVRTCAAYEGLARKVFPRVVVTIRHDLIRLPYTHIVMECEK